MTIHNPIDPHCSGSVDNQAYLEFLYDIYLTKPASLSADWLQYFANLSANCPQFAATYNHQHASGSAALDGIELSQAIARAQKINALLNAYRRHGHLGARLDPLKLKAIIHNTHLDIRSYEFSGEDLKQAVKNIPGVDFRGNASTLLELHQELQALYCHTLGFEYMHLNNDAEVNWFKDYLEQPSFSAALSEPVRGNILRGLIAAESFEQYLGTNYIGQKRFSLEGADVFIPLLTTMIEHAAVHGATELVLGMAHRGRLNVLANIMGKDAQDIFAGFAGQTPAVMEGSGDVKYHLGYCADVLTTAGPVHLSLAYNPSHLEIITPVVQGSVRLKQDRYGDRERRKVIPIIIHGDAAIAGQGVVMETCAMAQTRSFTVGGSIHLIINNQIGFTISDVNDARSTLYCSDIAKMLNVPVIHVNGDDPEAAYRAALLAVEYRQLFNKDIIIDLICYRRHGHNEADEPAATQPKMYHVIRNLPTVAAQYANLLTAVGVLSEETVAAWRQQYIPDLLAGHSLFTAADEASYQFHGCWEPWQSNNMLGGSTVKTAVAITDLQALATQLERLPPDFVVQAQVSKMLAQRTKMTKGEVAINWGYAETLAYASLLAEGCNIRLCGQDAARGTFAHRHAVLHDQETGQTYTPLQHLAKASAKMEIVNSLLSEEAVLAFEYGFASTDPNYLTLWEAQFGDFANGAQVVIDQFISAAEQKWGKLCGLVLLLPHGYEGMGPEHSSARLERYLQLCAQDNMQVCQPTTPAQMFHLLRRQILAPYRKPLIVLTPKSLLRHHSAVSSLTDLSTGEFYSVYLDAKTLNSKSVERLILCTGKVYYDLLDERQKRKLDDKVSLVRLEQLYPWPLELMQQLVQRHAAVTKVVWCQEEPENQGAWQFVRHNLMSLLTPTQQLVYAGRPAAASPAVGYYSVHKLEQEQLLNQAFN